MKGFVSDHLVDRKRHILRMSGEKTLKRCSHMPNMLRHFKGFFSRYSSKSDVLTGANLLQGFSLTEILIVCVIASFALLVLGQIAISQYHLYHWQQALARLQENGRFASFTLKRGIEEAGYIGCGRLGDLMTWQNQTNQVLSASRFIRGYQASGQTWQPSLPGVLPKTVLIGSDVVEVNTTKDMGAVLMESMSSPAMLMIHSQQAFSKGDPILISDCQHADVVNIMQVSQQGAHRYQVMINTPLGHLYQQGAFVGKVVHILFYIADTKRVNAMGDPIHALYTFDEQGRNTELISGVSGMSITYEINGKYLKASEITPVKRWQLVTAVAISLSVDSLDPVPHPVPDISADHRLYKTWPVNINLQERVPI